MNDHAFAALMMVCRRPTLQPVGLLVVVPGRIRTQRNAGSEECPYDHGFGSEGAEAEA